MINVTEGVLFFLNSAFIYVLIKANNKNKTLADENHQLHEQAKLLLHKSNELNAQNKHLKQLNSDNKNEIEKFKKFISEKNAELSVLTQQYNAVVRAPRLDIIAIYPPSVFEDKKIFQFYIQIEKYNFNKCNILMDDLIVDLLMKIDSISNELIYFKTLENGSDEDQFHTTTYNFHEFALYVISESILIRKGEALIFAAAILSMAASMQIKYYYNLGKLELFHACKKLVDILLHDLDHESIKMIKHEITLLEDRDRYKQSFLRDIFKNAKKVVPSKLQKVVIEDVNNFSKHNLKLKDRGMFSKIAVYLDDL